ncbi:MAG: hypothetical protein A2589_03065 [Candidatus Vogelbacteria bacterium RIFOXYD1_FULL_46_19]|uniref:HIT domain-containing protein n=1 Tax=Candidatus Vogelbacteria bacterium RIFOXYD1_FULL_46_19 TaxID=1802439 RepID=A0A1G2QGU3_9BACT|nr:MAG: hypothetical protein A2589_03065 [Candidatus Vogelbacteria bacterium RIFOXYD1_FULL_46_19]
MEKQSVKYSDGTIIENKTYRWVVNMFPKFEGHTMVVPKRHVTKIGSETTQEIKDREELVALAAKTLNETYNTDGVEVFLQTGLNSESSIKHLHWHVVSSQASDPLRGFDKLGHFFTIQEDNPKIIIFPVPIKKAKTQLLKALAKTLGRKGR